jgi:putative endonuclease
MAEHNLLGKIGEEAACRYLTQLEWRLLHRNWRCGHWEVDIIADDFGELVFVEVKTRSDENFMEAFNTIKLEKKEHLLSAAKAYMSYFHLDQPLRFDIVTVVGKTPPFTITLYENAFTPQGVMEERRKKIIP